MAKTLLECIRAVDSQLRQMPVFEIDLLLKSYFTPSFT